MDNILVLNGNTYAEAVEGLGRVSFDQNTFLKRPEVFKLVLFTGGADVSPELYGEKSPRGYCHTHMERDIMETFIYQVALRHNIPMAGICRGSQLLNVLSGGRLMHHIEHHGLSGNHSMTTSDGKIMDVTSTHHQMNLPGPGGYIIGWSTDRRSSVYIGNYDEPVEYKGLEVEAFCYPTKRIFAVQYHPEYMQKSSDGYKWFKEGVEALMHLSPKEFASRYVREAVR